MIEHHPQRIQIGSPVYALPRQLFGRHVGRRTKHHAGTGARRIGDACNTEIRHVDLVAKRVVHDVGGLDVTVHDMLAMRVIERICHPGHERKHDRPGQQGLRPGMGLQIAAGQQLHGNIGQPIDFAGIVDGDDIRMAQTTGTFRLAEKALPDLAQRIGIELLRQRHGLDCQRPPDLRIVPLIDLAHRPLAEHPFEHIAPQAG